MTDLQSQITWILGTALSICILFGLLVRWALMPYLREHLIEPMKQVEKQVTENHHSNKVPTLPDRLDDVRSDVKTLSAQMTTLATMFDGHMSWSEEWVTLMESRMDKAEHGRRKRWI